ncbi:MAG: helix-turn-helix transcriptional regulator [Acidobacteria bacterium]|nr:helix-turn-helix transcriptional regulator [Acidobacteriota bacterium]
MKQPIVDVLWIARFDYQAGWVLRPHKHDYYQLLLFLEGRGEFTVADEEFAVRGGACFLIRPGEAHSLRARTPVKTLDVKFRVSAGALAQALAGAARWLEWGQMGLAGKLERIRMEGERRAAWYQEMCSALFKEVLFLYLRQQQERTAPQHLEGTDDLIPRGGPLERALAYLREHSGAQMAVSDMARAAGCSERTLRAQFQRVLHTAPLAYLQEQRITRAKQLMQYSDYSLKEIARRVGFQNVHHFTRLFSGVEGRGPAAWRRQYLEGIRKDVIINPEFSNRSFVVAP